ncbi:putative PAS domain, phytochrome, phytochrome, central region, PAS domain superfamily [Helianthus annuus]|uniref:Phytochrome, PAS domain superfamily n=1 Tax=Helianthus annuus TaxID=4232 RepID=A0A251U458_HELAN|nr:putative phytochrome, PAS domain superfamily [Helianthus annuus]KAJ0552478.1 putative PAS domain, phytochrome, phytochrome, central region, PAS domain superfamily [Helianthus annuus]KAJ0896606.1 putative PAS domain, phytochrome, phytochrome, central region, PAS domain superfamily [Helianthus annuus]
MHPRSSFNAFLEVVKSRSLPWENTEMDAIHSLQLILRDSFKDVDEYNSKGVVSTQVKEPKMHDVDEISLVAHEMVRLIETAIVPILTVDVEGRINGWNTKVAELTGLSVENAMGKSLVQDLVYKESEETVANLLYQALRGTICSHTEFWVVLTGWRVGRGSICVRVKTGHFWSRSKQPDYVDLQTTYLFIFYSQ